MLCEPIHVSIHLVYVVSLACAPCACVGVFDSDCMVVNEWMIMVYSTLSQVI